MRALIEKELRENVRWLPIGLILISILTWMALPGRSAPFHPTATVLVQLVGFGAAVFALALGILQSAFDLRNADRAYLTHRSVTMWQIVGAKLVAGFLIYAIAVSIPLTVAALWMHREGLDFRPIRPAQVVPAMVMSLACFLLHPTAMFVLARPARWFGTKALPMVTVIFGIFVCGGFLGTSGLAKSSIPIPFIICFAALITFAAYHAWRDLWTEAEAQPWTFMHISTSLQLFSGSLVLSVFVVAVGMWTFESPVSRPDTESVLYDSFAVDAKSGVPWYVSEGQSLTDDRFLVHDLKSGSHIIDGQQPSSVGELPIDFEKSHFVAIQRSVFNSGMASDGFFTSSYDNYTNPLSRLIYDERGFILAYVLKKNTAIPPKLSAIIAADGIHRTTVPQGVPFRGRMKGLLPYDATGNPIRRDSMPIVSTDGIFLFSRDLTKFETVLMCPVEWICHFPRTKSHDKHSLLIASQGMLQEYQWVKKSSEASASEFGDKGSTSSSSPIEVSYELEKVRETVVPPMILELDKQNGVSRIL